MKHLKETRTKFILSKSGQLYKVVINDNNEQLKIIWLVFNLRSIYSRKRDIHYAFYKKGLNVDFVCEKTKSVTYKCPKSLQDEVLRIVSKL